MKGSHTVVKTAQGVAEVKEHRRGLPPRVRTMLILIDGTLNVAQLETAAATLGVPPGFLDELERRGLIEVRTPSAGPTEDATRAPPSEEERFRQAQRFMNDTAVDALGFRAFFFTLKMERCATRADLKALLDDYTRAITKGSGTDVARALVARARQLLD